MKNGSNSWRLRSRARRGNGNGVNHHYDSNGQGARIRGTANQIFEKYQSLAQDAFSSSDWILVESHLQHAEHYFRIMRSNNSTNGKMNALTGDYFYERLFLAQSASNSQQEANKGEGSDVDDILEPDQVSGEEGDVEEDESSAAEVKSERKVRSRSRGRLRRGRSKSDAPKEEEEGVPKTAGEKKPKQNDDITETVTDLDASSASAPDQVQPVDDCVESI